MANPRATNAPCPCGSGLTGLRNLTESCVGYVSCRKCQIIPAPKEYRESYDQQAKRNSAARRRLEEMRDCEQ
jgi:hypothetical protein